MAKKKTNMHTHNYLPLMQEQSAQFEGQKAIFRKAIYICCMRCVNMLRLRVMLSIVRDRYYILRALSLQGSVAVCCHFGCGRRLGIGERHKIPVEIK